MSARGSGAWCVASAALALAGGCTCRSATPAAPDWGGVDLEVARDGEAPRRIARDGAVCRGRADNLDAAVHTAEDAAPGGWWSLWIHPEPPEVWWSTRSSRADAGEPGPTWVARGLDGVRASGARILLDGVRLEPVGAEGPAIVLRGEVRCPTLPDAAPPDAVAALTRVAPPADGVVHVDGGLAWVAVPIDGAAGALDRVREALPAGTVGWLGGALASAPDQVQLVVAAGGRATDIVRWAGVGVAEAGLDPVDVAVRAEGLRARFGLDLVAADPASITLRVPPGVDRPALAAALAEACPDAVAAEGGVEAVAEALATEPVAVCSWR